MKGDGLRVGEVGIGNNFISEERCCSGTAARGAVHQPWRRSGTVGVRH